jgi:Protein of unknown function (DUF1404)
MGAAVAAAQHAGSRQVGAWMTLLTSALILTPPLRHLVESQMALHMLVQFPLLVACGWLLSRLAVGVRPVWRHFDALNAHGLLGIATASCVLAVWMVPAALDLALLSEPMRWAKYASLCLAGLLLGRSYRRLNTELEVFFTGMLAWMMATVGLIYQTMPQRLCVNYLIDEQRWTGSGLVLYAGALALACLWRLQMRRE